MSAFGEDRAHEGVEGVSLTDQVIVFELVKQGSARVGIQMRHKEPLARVFLRGLLYHLHFLIVFVGHSSYIVMFS